ncbi:MAG: FAD-binding oxidoreductase [Synechococcaceae cyanobacterium SM2_3_60]|nr:FAD-binding oxidoreductase [Synechococcaceae cyanobacterium SM2_3_60]
MTEILIVGGGIVGVAIAYALRDQRSVTVLTGAEDPPATTAALGVLHGISSKQASGVATDLRLQSWQSWQTWFTELALEPLRGLRKLVPETEVDQWQATLTARRAAGYDVDWAEPIATGYHTLWSPGDAQLDPLATLAALRFASPNVTFCSERVVQLERTDQRISAVTTTQQRYTPNWVILAAGLASQTLAAQIGLDLPLQGVKGTALEVELASEPPPLTASPDCNWVPRAAKRLWIGATVDFQATEPTPTAAELATLQQETATIWPRLAVSQTISTWSGWRPRPKRQRAPIIGQALANLWLATGHYRNGILLAPITALILRDLLLHGRTERVDIANFAPKGLESGK